MAQFRLGILPIEIEVGQYRQKSLSDRAFPFCKNEVEDEIQFLFNCMMYNQQKKTLCLGIEKTFVNRDKTLIRKFVMEHCPKKLANISLMHLSNVHKC